MFDIQLVLTDKVCSSSFRAPDTNLEKPRSTNKILLTWGTICTVLPKYLPFLSLSITDLKILPVVILLSRVKVVLRYLS